MFSAGVGIDEVSFDVIEFVEGLVQLKNRRAKVANVEQVCDATLGEMKLKLGAVLQL